MRYQCDSKAIVSGCCHVLAKDAMQKYIYIVWLQKHLVLCIFLKLCKRLDALHETQSSQWCRHFGIHRPLMSGISTIEKFCAISEKSVGWWKSYNSNMVLVTSQLSFNHSLKAFLKQITTSKWVCLKWP